MHVRANVPCVVKTVKKVEQKKKKTKKKNCFRKKLANKICALMPNILNLRWNKKPTYTQLYFVYHKIAAFCYAGMV